MNNNETELLFPNLYNNILPFRELIIHISKISKVIHQQGWAEANAGNISIRISDLLMPFIRTNSLSGLVPCFQNWQPFSGYDR